MAEEKETKKEEIDSVAPDTDDRLKELEKQLKSKEEQLGKMGSEIDWYKKEYEAAAIMADIVASDEDILKSFQDVYKKRYAGVVDGGQKTSEQQGKKNQEEDLSNLSEAEIKKLDEKVNRVEGTQRNQAVAEFENRAGLSQMDKEEADKIRKSVEREMNVWGHSIKSAPVEMLPTLLEKAYKSHMVDENKYSAYAEAYTNASGSMPHLSSRRNAQGEEDVLSSEQKKWAEKFGLDVKKVEKTYKERDSESVRKTATEQGD